MTALDGRPAPEVTRPARPRASHGLRFLQVHVVAMFLFPPDLVLRPVGASGYPGALVAFALSGVYLLAVLTGFHRPLRHRYPVRGALVPIWVVSLISYAGLQFSGRDGAFLRSGDRFLLLLLAFSVVVMATAELLRSWDEVQRLARTLVVMAAFSGFVAVLQSRAGFDLTRYLRLLPGFDSALTGSQFELRGGLERAGGTALHPIELGVVSGMLLPLAVALLLSDRTRRLRWRLAPVPFLLFGCVSSVSRSALVSGGIALVVFVLLLPSLQRLIGLALLPVAAVAVFVTTPGFVSTITSFFLAGTNDPSIGTRVGDYPLVVRLVSESPWVGRGGGAYLAPNFIDIFDNQYLTSAVELGLLGVAALVVLLLTPPLTALAARAASDDPDVRIVCAALVGGGASAAVCSATFDSLSFATFVATTALLSGLTGACWLQRTARPRTASTAARTLGPPDDPTVPERLPR